VRDTENEDLIIDHKPGNSMQSIKVAEMTNEEINRNYDSLHSNPNGSQ